MNPNHLEDKLNLRKQNNTLRALTTRSHNAIDFFSNDYLGFAAHKNIALQAKTICADFKFKNGSTGSRLLSGNTLLHEQGEKEIASFFNAPTGLLFNSGYDANLGFFSSVPQKNDVILYDELIHASIRDGMKLSYAKSYKFKHNNIEDLNAKLQQAKQNSNNIFIAIESVYSMDGDNPNLLAFTKLSKKNNCFLIVDEAHAAGVFGEFGKGLVSQLQLEKEVFARIVTFGKALGCHGAMVLGSDILKTYLYNFARSFIYTTAMPAHSVATLISAVSNLKSTTAIQQLHQNITYFKSLLKKNKLEKYFIESNSAIHCCVVPGNTAVKQLAQKIQTQGFDVKPVLSPTVSEGQERLRICLHSYNTQEQINKLLHLLKTEI